MLTNTLALYDPYNPLSLESVVARFPTIAAEHPSPDRSKRFAHIGTLNALTRLDAEGFKVHGVQVQRVKASSGRAGFEKHVIRMRKPGAQSLDRARQLGDVYPEIIMRNAHDGTSAWEFMAGLMRLVCLNGMTVGTQWGSVRVRHVGADTAKRVIDATYTVVDSFTRVAESVDRFRSITLGEDAQHEFARQAYALRYNIDAETGIGSAPVTPYALLNVRRGADNSADLWAVFNRVQENLVRGGQRGRTVGDNGRVRRATTRALTGIDQGLRVNRALFDLTETWADRCGPARVADRAAFAAA